METMSLLEARDCSEKTEEQEIERKGYLRLRLFLRRLKATSTATNKKTGGKYCVFAMYEADVSLLLAAG